MPSPRIRRVLAACAALALWCAALPALAQQAPLTHTVADGETLSQIAQRFHVSASEIAEWVQQTFTSVTIDGTTFYDLTAPLA